MSIDKILTKGNPHCSWMEKTADALNSLGRALWLERAVTPIQEQEKIRFVSKAALAQSQWKVVENVSNEEHGQPAHLPIKKKPSHLTGSQKAFRHMVEVTESIHMFGMVIAAGELAALAVISVVGLLGMSIGAPMKACVLKFNKRAKAFSDAEDQFDKIEKLNENILRNEEKEKARAATRDVLVAQLREADTDKRITIKNRTGLEQRYTGEALQKILPGIAKQADELTGVIATYQKRIKEQKEQKERIQKEFKESMAILNQQSSGQKTYV